MPLLPRGTKVYTWAPNGTWVAKWAPTGRPVLLFLSALSQPTCALKIEDKALVRRRWRAAGGPGERHTSLDRTSKLEN